MLKCLIATGVIGIFCAGCGANESVLKSGRETPVQANVEPAKTTIETDIEAMRTAGFTFIYVLRRKDGQKLDAEDRGVLRLQTADANRRVTSDEDKAVVIGSNYAVPPKNMFVLFDRFAVENYSPPLLPADANAPANAAK
ncbi:MAG: hypothetical protein KBD94_06905 [Pyrinomonadaceae bacterium]|nr:hypothetical protein [Pyrinomonadaceae bacterium]